MTRPYSALLVLLLFTAVAAHRAGADDAALSLLTRGGGEILPGGLVPGLVELVGESSFPVLKDASGRAIAAGGAAPTLGGEGRVVAFAHDGFLKSREILSQASARELIFNAIRWCGGADDPEVAVHPDLDGLADALEEAGFKVERVAPAEVSRRTVKSVYVTVAQRGFDEEAIAAVFERSQQGGGLVLAATPWPFSKDYPNFANFPANLLAADAGIRLNSEGTASARTPFAVAHTDSNTVLATMDRLLREGLPTTDSDQVALANVLRSGSSLRGAAMDEFLKGLEALNRHLGPIVPTVENPLVPGAVAAPLYVAGQTDLREWREEIRRFPAPWAELASDRIILALPSRYLRDLSDPDKVLEAWDEIIEMSAELCGGVDRSGYRAERIVFERQISAGHMHSGYPVAAPQDRSVEQAVDARALRAEGNWGFFHEYGHNHQHDLWALPGTGETTCNLWSVYLFEEWVGKPRAEGHRAIRHLDRRQRLNAYYDGGRNFEKDWNVWTALETYLQVQETFRWEPFKQVFAEYNALPEAEWPKTQQEKNDQWVIRLSRASGKSLAPFWRAWKVPLSGAVEEALAALPVWEDHPVAGWDECK